MSKKLISEIMTNKLEKISMSASAQEAAKMMANRNVNSLIVNDMNDKDIGIGILTERILVRIVVAD